MNANELADELDKSRQEPFTSEYLVGQAVTMLRKQQTEIEALKYFLKENKLHLSFIQWQHGEGYQKVLRKAQEK